MIFKELPILGVFLVESEVHRDDRGFFTRSFCKKEFESKNLDFEIVQTSVSFNSNKGTLRGMHYQVDPFSEIKLIRCIKGAIYDVIIDLRANSKTYGQWVSTELTANGHTSLYVPRGFAHGFQTLINNTEILYYMSNVYSEQAARGIRWDDPTLAIKWPNELKRTISNKDKSFPFF